MVKTRTMILQNTYNFFKFKPVAPIGALFSFSSLLLAFWAASLPSIQKRLELNDSELGFMLLLAPLGALTAIFVSNFAFSKIKVGYWLGYGNIVHALLFCIEVASPYPFIFGITLFIRGLIGFLNSLARNSTVAELEKKYNKRLLSTCHGLYSFGGAVGALLAALFFSLEINSLTQISIITLLTSLLILIWRKQFSLTDSIIQSKSGFKWPNKNIISLSFICLVLFMAEGSVVDWSSIYLKRDLLAPLALISIGYGGFSAAMTLGRLNGDRIIPFLGERRTIIYGSFLTAIGFTVVSLSFSPIFAIIGFILSGLGACCVVPVLFRAASHVPNVSTVQGISMITSGGLIGFMAGPSIIGFISEQFNLSTGFFFEVILLLLAAILGWRNKFLA